MALTSTRPQAESDIFHALRNRDAAAIRALLDSGVALNVREATTGMTPLLVAAGLSDARIVRQLIDAGADPFTVDSRGSGTALHRAVQAGDLETIRLLVEEGLFVDAVAPTTGHTPLMDALWYKWPDVVEFLFAADAGLNLSTHYGFSLQEHFQYELSVNIVGQDRLLIADEMLQRRIAADAMNAEQCKLVNATASGDIAAARMVLAEGADVDERYPVMNSFNDKHTPLLIACRDGHLELVRLLLEHGADVNATEPTFGAVPLHKAVYNGHDDITAELVTVPGVDLDYQGYTNGYTPLHDALWHGYEQCAQILLDAGARIDLVGHDGKTPGDVAAEAFGPRHPITRELREQLATA
jgi:ankyrin repeat protein